MATQTDSDLSTKKLTAGLMGIFFGAFGVHKFVLGYQNPGIIMLAISIGGGIVTCGAATGVMSIIGLIEGIIYLTKTPEEFREMYIDNEKAWF